MEQRLKERLTGAAILVALIVLIVPELFHGHLTERAGKSVNSSEGPPMRSYLIDLGANHSPMQLGAAPASGVASSPPVSAPTASAESIAPPSVPLDTAVRHASAPTHTSAAAARAAAQSVPTKALARSSASGPEGKGAADWTVQLGLYAKRANAEHMVQVAHTRGFSASLTKPDTKGRYRVRVAGVTTRSAAFKLVARLRAAGLPAAAVGPQ